MKYLLILLQVIFLTCNPLAANASFPRIPYGNDSISVTTVGDIPEIATGNKRKFFWDNPASRFIVPAGMLTYGIVSRESHALKKLDDKTNKEVSEHFIGKLHLDDYFQYTPAVAVYALDLCGVKARHNFKDRTIVMATSHLLMAATVYTLKNTSPERRPDGSAKNSFPSGHTATAFTGAHILFYEYKDVSPWIGVGGYFLAASTGGLRIYNKKHWVSDVVMGAGIGIASVEIAYLLLPLFSKENRRIRNKSFVVLPSAGPRYAGLGMSAVF